MSKYQRIGNIENYLKSLQSNLQRMKTSMDQKYTTGDSNILLKIKALESSINVIKLEMNGIKKSNLENGKREKSKSSGGREAIDSGRWTAQIEENTAKIEALQASFLSLENTLKSIQEIMKTEKASP